MKKNHILAGIIVILLIAFGAYYLGTQRETAQEEIDNTGTRPIEPSLLYTIEGNKDDLLSFSVSSGDEIMGFLSFDGTIKNGYFFEGNIGVNILDQNKKLLKAGNGTALWDWMTTGPVAFSGTIDMRGLPSGPGYIQIANDNASGLPEHDKFIYIPVIIGQSKSGENYTYKNHGFTIELPKGFTPREEQAEGGPYTTISLPTGSLSYTGDASWHEKYSIPGYTYIKDQKIGETTFKVYESVGARYYWFKRGAVGYEFGGTDIATLENLLKTFRFVGWAE